MVMRVKRTASSYLPGSAAKPGAIRRISSGMASSATIVITVAAELAMPLLMRLIAPGFAAEPGKYELAVLLTRITMPYLPCMALYAHLSGVLNARNRFILSAGAPILLNLWTLAAVLPAKSP